MFIQTFYCLFIGNLIKSKIPNIAKRFEQHGPFKFIDKFYLLIVCFIYRCLNNHYVQLLEQILQVYQIKYLALRYNIGVYLAPYFFIFQQIIANLFKYRYFCQSYLNIFVDYFCLDIIVGITSAAVTFQSIFGTWVKVISDW